MMYRMLARRQCLVLALIIGACATKPNLVPGQSTEADVRTALGAPTEVRALADGSRLLWYSRPLPDTAYGSERMAVTLGPDGKLRSMEQRLAPQYIAKVVPEQTKASDVRDLIGPPSRAYARAGKSGEVWEYELQGFQRPLTLYIEFSPDQVVQAVYTLERSSPSSDRPRHR